MTGEQQQQQQQYEQFQQFRREQQELQHKLMRAQQDAQRMQQMLDTEPRQQYAIIVAVDQMSGFSKGGEIPWNYPADFKWFKQQTTGHICIMGKTTYENINKRLGEKAADSVLPNRKCFVVSTTLNQDDVKNATVIKNPMDAVNHFSVEDFDKTVFFIGGEKIFRAGLSIASTVYVTVINKDYECDKFFPVDHVLSCFAQHQVHKTNEDGDLRFVTYKRNKQG